MASANKEQVKHLFGKHAYNKLTLTAKSLSFSETVLHVVKLTDITKYVYNVVKLTDIMNYVYNEVKLPIPGTLLKACFTVFKHETGLQKLHAEL